MHFLFDAYKNSANNVTQFESWKLLLNALKHNNSLTYFVLDCNQPSTIVVYLFIFIFNIFFCYSLPSSLFHLSPLSPLTFFYLLISLGVDQIWNSWIEDCFQENTTLCCSVTNIPLFDWYTYLNHVCNELKASKKLRSGVPQSIGKYEIQKYLRELMKSSEEWHAMKLVVLGHGRIGKTTMLTKLHSILTPNENITVFSLSLLPLSLYLSLSTLQNLQDIKSTVGIECKTISIAKRDVMVRDFAGQLEYITTHQFFLSKEVFQWRH
jgi:hypothetical protein